MQCGFWILDAIECWLGSAEILMWAYPWVGVPLLALSLGNFHLISLLVVSFMMPRLPCLLTGVLVKIKGKRAHGIILHSSRKCKILLLKRVTHCLCITVDWYLYSADLLLMYQETQALTTLGQLGTTTRNLMEHSLKNIFLLTEGFFCFFFFCFFGFFFGFERSTWYLLLFSNRAELGTCSLESIW